MNNIIPFRAPLAPAEKPAQPVSAAPADVVQAFDLTPEEFSAVAAYVLSLSQPTPNADGVHVGDIFFDVWGYDQTNVDFYQVVSLKGRHTAVIRKIAGTREYEGDMYGHTSPRRDVFTSDELHTVRTKTAERRDGIQPVVNNPRFRDSKMDRTTDFKTHFFSDWA